MTKSNDRRANAISRELGQHLSRLSTVVVITAAVVVTVAVLVTLGIRENRERRAKIGERAKRAADAMETSGKKLKKLREEFERLRAIARKKEEARATKPQPVVAQPIAPTEVSKPPDLDKKIFDAALDAMKEGAAADVRGPLVARASERLQTLSSRDADYRVMETLLVEMLLPAGQFEKNKAEAEAASKASNDFQVDKETIPLPSLGEVKIDPKIALIGLALMTAAAYIVVMIETRRVLSLVGRARGAAMTLAPAWIYTEDPKSRRVLGWREGEDGRRYISAMVIHGGWIALSLFLAVNLLMTLREDRMDRRKQELAAVDTAIAAIVIGANVAAAWFFARQFAPRLAVSATRTWSTTPVVTRRAAVGLILAGTAGTAIYMAVQRSRTKAANLAQQIRELFGTRPAPLAQNMRTHVVHGTLACKHHLPKHRERELQSNGIPHRGWEPWILYGAAKDLEAQLREEWKASKPPDRIEATQKRAENFKEVIELLLLAIAQRPWSYHLHDRLIRVYGGLKRYNDIRILLDRSINDAKVAIQRGGSQAKAAQRALEHFGKWKPRKPENAKKRASK